MRGDGVGVGDVGEVPYGAWVGGHTAGGDDGGGAIGGHDGGMVGGHGRGKRDAATERSGDGIGIDDGTRVGDGSHGVHGTGTGGADGMRGDRVGVGDVGEVPYGAWGWGHTTGGDDGGRSTSKHIDGLVGGRCEYKRDQ